MRFENHAKRKLQSGQPAFGFQASYGSPIIVEAFAASGNDFVLIDTQHGSWGPDSTTPAFIAARAGGAIPMARVTRNFFPMIGRLLDEGALGIVIPQVDTPEQAKAAADACRLPPTGNRSWGWGRALNLGAACAVVVAVHVRPLGEQPLLRHLPERCLVREVVVLPVHLVGARLARGVRHREAERDGLVVQQPPREGGFARPGRRAEDEQEHVGHGRGYRTSL